MNIKIYKSRYRYFLKMIVSKLYVQYVGKYVMLNLIKSNIKLR